MYNLRRCGGTVTSIGLALLMGAKFALATDAKPPTDPGAFDGTKIKELEDKVNERDLIIRDLLRRVESLEHAQSSPPSTAPAPPSPRQSPATAAPAGAAASQAANNSSPPASAASPPATQEAMTPKPPDARPPGSEPAMAGPGEFEVSEEDAKRALERALVQTGAALLPTGTFEVVPSMTYAFRRDALPSQIALTTTGTVLITETVTRTTAIENNALIRVGLPFGTQAELGLPWVYKNVQTATRVSGAGLNERTVEVQGLGDPSVSLSKQIFTEEGLRPSVFVGGTWNSNFGQVKNSLPLGTGFNEFSAGVTAVKRQDPLVFTAGFSYQYTLENNRFKPGDQYIPSVGMLFAVSPETSLRFSQQLSFGGSDAFNGQRIPGSEKTVGIFSFGVLSVLGRGLVVNLTGGIGETHDAPDMFLQLAVPIRLN